MCQYTTIHSDVRLQYHQRLLTLDIQVMHLEAKSLLGLGQWLNQKWYQCQTKKTIAQAELVRAGIPEDEIREQWALQLQYQSQSTSCMCPLAHDR